MIDNITHHETPEGIELALTPAGIVPRAGAWFIDALIRRVISFVAYVLLIWFGASGYGLILIVMFLVDWFYMVYFEVFRGGQTIGKRQFGITVVMDGGMPIGWQASMTRNLLRVADVLPFGYFVGVVSSLASTQNKRLGDIVAGTMVVYVPSMQADFDIADAAVVTPPIALTMKEQQAILAFAERVDELPSERSDELAGLLSGMTGTRRVQDGVRVILGYANAIIGRTSAHGDTPSTASNQNSHHANHHHHWQGRRP